MYKMSRVKIAGFRRLRSIDLEMRPLMVLIGANGVGKTSLLDAFSLLSASAAGRMNEKLNSMGGIADTLTRNRADKLIFHIYMDVPKHEPLEYDLHLSTKGTSYAISLERLSQHREGHDRPFMHILSSYDDIKFYEIEENKLLRPNWEHNPLETSLSQAPKMFSQPEALRRILSSASQYHVLDVGQRAPVKLPQQMKPVNLPGEQGEELIPLLYSLKESDKEVDRARYETIIDTLRAAFHEFESLGFPPVGAGMLGLTWKEKYFSSPLYAHQLSEGTLRFLWLISLLQSPGLSSITMIDEPEVSLHPELLGLFVELLREASQRTQIVIATHSDRLVRFLTPNEVVVLDKDEEGCTNAVWADTLDLDAWLSEYSLDELWSMKRMGGGA